MGENGNGHIAANGTHSIAPVGESSLAHPGGAKGGGAPKVRAYMLHMARVLDKADDLLGTEWEANAKFARSVRDCQELPARDRIRAAELLDAMAARGLVAANKIAEIEEPKQASAQVNVNVQTAFKVEFDKGG